MQRAAGITYYEELGVAQTATPDEIRDTFRSLVRLLHPDQQTDEELKQIAESQMRKLNRIYDVLSDVDRRRRYDDILEYPRSIPAIVFSGNSGTDFRRWIARFAWVAAVAIAMLVLIWLASEGPAAVPVQSFNPPAPQKAVPLAPTDSQTEIATLRANLDAARTERDIAIKELARLRGNYERKVEAPTPPLPERAAFPRVTPATVAEPLVSRDPGLPAAPLDIVHSPPAAASAAPSRSFAGFWFYARPGEGQHNKNASLYPPEFIEATLTEQSGLVHGRYRSRYQIVDRAISPDVNFEFSGAPSGLTIVCPWSGTGGARGELTLRLSGENAMEIEWTARELGSVQGLASGTARLTRRLE